MKKIVLISPAHPLRGGIASSSQRLAKALQDKGAEVVIFSFSLQYPGFLFPGKTQFTDDPAPPDLTIHTSINSVNPISWIKTGQAIKKLQPDLIITRYWIPFMGPALGTILRVARWNSKSKTVALADNIIPHESRPGDRPFTRYFIGANDGFIVMSKSVESDIRQFNKQKAVTFIPHPIYDNYGEPVDRVTALKQLGLSPDFRYVLFFGFIRKYKGLDLLLEAFAKENVQQLPLRLIIAGEFYSNKEQYLQQIEQSNLKDRIILEDRFISHDAVKYYFGAADLVAQPYKTATQSGISQLAYHFNKPMVVTKVGGLPEIVAHGKVGYVVPVDASAIAAAIADFFLQNRSEDMTKAVLVEKKKFSWEHMVEGIQNIYQRIK